MKIHIIAVGRAPNSPEQELVKRYQKRMQRPFLIHEVVAKKSAQGSLLKQAEAKLLASAIPNGGTLIALDEDGEIIDSHGFAKHIEHCQNRGIPHISFLVGGADGLCSSLKKKADITWSFGRLTWPHMLVRAMLCEQLYRAQQICVGHPYHRT